MYAIQSDLVTVSSNAWLSKFGMKAVLKVDYYDSLNRDLYIWEKNKQI